MTERFITPGTPCTARQRELLHLLIEEAAEVQQRATKALRFGLDETQPGQPHDNAARLGHEVGDLTAVVSLLTDEGICRRRDISVGIQNKGKQLERFLQTDPDAA